MTEISMDVSELIREGERLADAANGVMPEIRKVVSKGALNVKNQMQSEAAGSRHFKFASTINYDLTGNAVMAEAEIGPRKLGAGNLANIAYFGGSRGGGGTVPDPEGAMNAEASGFESALADVIADALGAD